MNIVTALFSTRIRWTRARDRVVWAIMNEINRSSLAILGVLLLSAVKTGASGSNRKAQTRQKADLRELRESFVFK
jgi:hypothetical protein